MKNLVNKLDYRDNDYFNNKDFFVILTNLNSYYVSTLEYYNGYWFTNTPYSQYKAITVRCVNVKELMGCDIMFNGVKGYLNKVMENNFGVYYYQGKQIRKYGLPTYWLDSNNFKDVLV